MDSPLVALGATAGGKRFPDRLYELLHTDAAPKSLFWLPGGKAFAIEQETFSSEVLDKYFQATKFASFVRRLHKWYVLLIFRLKTHYAALLPMLLLTTVCGQGVPTRNEGVSKGNWARAFS